MRQFAKIDEKIDEEIATTYDKGATDFDLMNYYGLLPHIGVNVCWCNIVKKFEWLIKVFRK